MLMMFFTRAACGWGPSLSASALWSPHEHDAPRRTRSPFHVDKVKWHGPSVRCDEVNDCGVRRVCVMHDIGSSAWLPVRERRLRRF